MPSSRIIVNLSLPAEMAEAIRAKATREERTVSSVLRRAAVRDLERDRRSENESSGTVYPNRGG